MAKRHAGGRSMRECTEAGTLADLMRRHPDEESCERRLLEEAYTGGFVCPACGNARSSKVAGRARKWQRSRRSRQLGVTKGTMMEGTHLVLTKWFMTILLEANDRRGISASELQGFIGCSYRTSAAVLACIRCAMARSECVRCPRS